MSELVENLREACIDFSGEAIADHSEPRRIVDCGELRKAADLIERQAGLLEEAKSDLEAIAKSRFGLQGIQEDYGHDNNAYNFQAMKYWAKLAVELQTIARTALAKLEAANVDA